MKPDNTDDRPFLGTVLVTGGCGFIGSFITEAFVAEPACSRVVVASRNPNRFRLPEVEYFPCDITNEDQIKSLLGEVRPHVVVHTISPGPFAILADHYRVSYLGTKSLLRLAKEHPSVRAFVWTSSVSAVHLDPGSNDRPIDEVEARVTDFRSRLSGYSQSKGATETFVLGESTDATTVDFSERADWRGKLLTTALRITGLYGQRDKTTIKEMMKVVNSLATRIQIGPNRLVHSMNYVESAANAHVDAAKALLDGKHLRPDMRVDGEAFWISDPTPMKLWDFTRGVYKAAGDNFCSKPQEQQRLVVIPFWVMVSIAWISECIYWIFTFGSRRPGMTVDHFEYMSRGGWFSIEKAKKRFGYTPVCDTEEGIRRTVKWFQENKEWDKTA